MRWFALFVLSLALSFGVGSSAFADGPGAAAQQDLEEATGERELLSRLVAPCCWNQTLDIHEGSAPDQLRAEIRSRLKAGESASSIEADMVSRYGARVRAGSQSSTLGAAGLSVIALALGVGVLLFFAVRRWLRAGRAARAQTSDVERDDRNTALDERLDAELRALD